MPKSTISAALLQEHLHGGGSVDEEGQKACRRNVPLRKCPYTDSGRRERWMKGWHDEQAEFMAS
ncbi:Rmf/CrpP family protein [Mesorhizobium sp. M0618]|uniref:Rmf/CrpP family protein n=1 Tax=unclassified Mesorhizobium TaxID=325217 RepID=UPI00333566A0